MAGSEPGDELPEQILAFVFAHIDSVELLQVLLLLRQKPEREWTVSEITRELASAEASIEKRLNDLYARNVLKRDCSKPDRHCYVPGSEELGRIIDELRQIYQAKPHWVINIIYSRPSEPLRMFADAFKIRKGD